VLRALSGGPVGFDLVARYPELGNIKPLHVEWSRLRDDKSVDYAITNMEIYREELAKRARDTQ
jgi:hypothetical protein